jgi:hypothetical protein
MKTPRLTPHTHGFNMTIGRQTNLGIAVLILEDEVGHYHAICLLDHANPETDTDHRDVPAARELKKLRESLNQPTTKETTRQMIAAANAKHGGKPGGEGNIDRRKFHRF